MWDLIVSVPDHCLSFYWQSIFILHAHNSACYVTLKDMTDKSTPLNNGQW